MPRAASSSLRSVTSTRVVVATRTKRAQALDLRMLDRRVNAQQRDRFLFFALKTVDADDRLLVSLDRSLIFVSGLLNLALNIARLNRPQHAAHRVDLFNIICGATLYLVRQMLDRVGARERVNRVGHARFVSDHLLRAQRDARRVFCRKRKSFVHRVRVQRLRSAKHGGERLDRRADDVDFRLLCGEGRARRLRMKAQHQ